MRLRRRWARRFAVAILSVTLCLLVDVREVHEDTFDAPKMFVRRTSKENLMEKRTWEIVKDLLKILREVDDTDSDYEGAATEVFPWLYLGAAYDATSLDWLTSNSIQSVLNMAAGQVQTGSAFYPPDISYLEFDAVDGEDFNITAHFDTALDFLVAAKAANRRAFVHCVAGVSRSATIVLAYLVKHEGMPLHEAVRYLAKRRPIVCPNDGFLYQLVDFAMKFGPRDESGMPLVLSATPAKRSLPPSRQNSVSLSSSSVASTVTSPGSLSPSPLRTAGNPPESPLDNSRGKRFGANIMQRFQVAVNHIAHFGDKYQISYELIVLEWNPLPDRRVADALTFPRSMKGKVRIIGNVTGSVASPTGVASPGARAALDAGGCLN